MKTFARARPSLLRQINERHVLAAIQTHGPLSRAEITRCTGISGPTVTRAVAALLEARLLEEGDFRPAALGRPSKVLRLAGKNVSVLGAVIGSQTCELVCSGLDGEIHDELPVTFSTPSDYDELVERFVAAIRESCVKEKTTVLGLGVSLPGLLNHREGRVLLSPNLHQTDGKRLGHDLSTRLGLEVATVQESTGLCLAERMYGAARGLDHFAIVDINEGLGVCVVNDGEVLEGQSGLAGELGHVTVELDGKPCGCGNRGCLETIATDHALVAAISERVGKPMTIEEIVTEVREGRLEMGAEFERAMAYLSVGLAAVVNLYNPQRIFVFGKFLDAHPDLFHRLTQMTWKRALKPAMADCEIIRAQGNKRLGAIAGIIQHITTGRDDHAE
jgi:predicted NBD/HSP70 family sugar kinase